MSLLSMDARHPITTPYPEFLEGLRRNSKSWRNHLKMLCQRQKSDEFFPPDATVEMEPSKRRNERRIPAKRTTCGVQDDGIMPSKSRQSYCLAWNYWKRLSSTAMQDMPIKNTRFFLRYPFHSSAIVMPLWQPLEMEKIYYVLCDFTSRCARQPH